MTLQCSSQSFITCGQTIFLIQCYPLNNRTSYDKVCYNKFRNASKYVVGIANSVDPDQTAISGGAV